MPDTKDLPREIKLLYYYGIVFGALYVIYAVVSIILSFMDRTYKDIQSNFLILIYGLPFIMASIGLKNMQRWGWIGYVLLMLLVVVLGLFRNIDTYTVLIMIFSVLALGGSMLPGVRKHYFGS